MTTPRASRCLGAALVLATSAVAGCADDPHVVVTIAGRPALHGVAHVAVRLANAGAALEQTFDLDAAALPVTFSASLGGRDGDLAITVTATDVDGHEVGAGTSVAPVADGERTVTIEPADFVVAGDPAAARFLADDGESGGVQLAAGADGQFAVVLRDPCPGGCDVLVRRFAADGTPRAPAGTDLGATDAIAINTQAVEHTTTPSIAVSDTGAVAVWDLESTIGDGAVNPGAVICQPLVDGAPSLAPVVLGSGVPADAASVTAIPGGTFAVTWTERGSSSRVVRAAVVDAACALVSGTNQLQAVLALAGGRSARSAIAGHASELLVSWITSDGSGLGPLSLAPTTPDGSPVDRANPIIVPVPDASGGGFLQARLVALADGYGVVTIRGTSLTDDFILELQRTSPGGGLLGNPTVVAHATSPAISSTAVAVRADGAVLVIWQGCGGAGDGADCGVFGRVLRPSGLPVGDAFGLSTLRQGDQTFPSAAALPDAFVVAFDDDSHGPPLLDTVVRARVIYPSYDDAVRVLGAACDTADTTTCPDGLACVADAADVPRCHETCSLAGASPLCLNGGSCAIVGVQPVCAF